jgi:peptidoglycan/xylan/chitin deacetylase (PgdA/CDA1 family)
LITLAGNSLTTILFHRFFFENELPSRSRDRLKRQCDWLCNRFTPLSLESATTGLAAGRLPQRPLLVTIDDAKIEILRAVDIFQSFGLPVSIFACVGWSAKESPIRDDPECILARVVSEIEWYKGPAKVVETSDGPITLGVSAEQTAKAIDFILANYLELRPEFAAILEQVKTPNSSAAERVSCSWADLRDLKAAGFAIGGHSVSHVKIAEATSLRMRFEISETRRILSQKFGGCDVFAYPYGMEGTFDDETTRQLSLAGFRYAFLTHSEFADANTDPLHLPRISMPDRAMSHPEFCVRAAGAGVVYRKIKRFFSRAYP